MKRTLGLLFGATLLFHFASRLPAPVMEETPAPTASPQNEDKREVCHIKKGDTLQSVKAFYHIEYDPTGVGDSDGPKPPFSSNYDFKEYGVWIFFDKDQKVRSFRFEKPFKGKIGNVAVGERREQILGEKGACQKEFRGMVDAEDLADRDVRIKKLVTSLPKTVPKSAATKAIEEVLKIEKEPAKFNKACLYSDGEGGFYRYDISPTSGAVQIIFSDRGN